MTSTSRERFVQCTHTAAAFSAYSKYLNSLLQFELGDNLNLLLTNHMQKMTIKAFK